MRSPGAAGLLDLAIRADDRSRGTAWAPAGQPGRAVTNHRVVTGNAGAATGGRGWFVGHFVPGLDDPRSTEAVEVNRRGDQP